VPLIILGLLVIIITAAYFYVNGNTRPASRGKKYKSDDSGKIIYLNREQWKEKKDTGKDPSDSNDKDGGHNNDHEA